MSITLLLRADVNRGPHHWAIEELGSLANA